jgi:hypothetical protein
VIQSNLGVATSCLRGREVHLNKLHRLVINHQDISNKGKCTARSRYLYKWNTSSSVPHESMSLKKKRHPSNTLDRVQNSNMPLCDYINLFVIKTCSRIRRIRTPAIMTGRNKFNTKTTIWSTLRKTNKLITRTMVA